MKVVSQRELGTVGPKAECVIVKNVLPKAACDAIVATMKQALTNKAPNERFSDNNWYHNVSKQGTHFHSFLLNDIDSPQCSPTLKAFKTLYRFYQALGDDIRGDFREHTETELPANQITINPLVFWYPTGTGCFGCLPCVSTVSAPDRPHPTWHRPPGRTHPCQADRRRDRRVRRLVPSDAPTPPRHRC